MIIEAKSEKRKAKSLRGGFTLIEMLVVLIIFSIVGILTTRSIALSLRNSRKSESISKVRENVEDAMNVMERCLRNAKSLDCASSSVSEIVYEDEYGGNSSFECSGGVIASNSAQITNTEVVVDCSSVFVCNPGGAGVPPSVNINIDATTAASYASGVEGFAISSQTKVLLRTY